MNLTLKDYVICLLVFILMVSLAPILTLVDETPLEAALPWFTGFFSIMAFFLWLPVHFLMIIPVKFSLIGYDRAGELSPMLAGLFYAFVVAFVLGYLNKRRKKIGRDL